MKQQKGELMGKGDPNAMSSGKPPGPCSGSAKHVCRKMMSEHITVYTPPWSWFWFQVYAFYELNLFMYQ